MEAVHKSVLLNECLGYLSPSGEDFEDGALMIDCTQGEGGHSLCFLERYPSLRIIGLDADSAIQAVARERLKRFEGRVDFRNVWFDDFFENYHEASKPDLILFDLGVSSYHYEKGGRGFSFRHDEVLDMRLNPELDISAGDIVNSMSEDDLANVIYEYSDERYSRSIARAIVRERGVQKITSTKVLADIIYNATPASYHHKSIHPATRTFQALRLCVNGDLERLPRALHNAFNVLSGGGKMGVITFQSLEDRIVKNYFRALVKSCVCPPGQAVCTCGGTPCAENLTGKGILPSEAEVKDNPPSRSARLRAVRKIRDAGRERMYVTPETSARRSRKLMKNRVSCGYHTGRL